MLIYYIIAYILYYIRTLYFLYVCIYLCLFGNSLLLYMLACICICFSVYMLLWVYVCLYVYNIGASAFLCAELLAAWSPICLPLLCMVCNVLQIAFPVLLLSPPLLACLLASRRFRPLPSACFPVPFFPFRLIAWTVERCDHCRRMFGMAINRKTVAAHFQPSRGNGSPGGWRLSLLS